MADINFPQNRKEITGRIKSDVNSELPASNPYLRNSFLQALIYGIGGRLFDIYTLAKKLLLNLFWDTATGEFLYRPASWFGVTLNAATGSTGNATIEGTVGTSIVLGTKFLNSDGLEFETDVLATVQNVNSSITNLTQSGGIATATVSSNHFLAPGIEITIAGADQSDYNGVKTVTTVLSTTQFQFAVDSGAVSPATGTKTVDYDIASLSLKSLDVGDDVNIDAGTELTISSPIAGLNDSCFAQFGGLDGASDQEDDEDFRDRFLFRVQNPVALFNEAAIKNKALEITGVTRVWTYNVDTTKGSKSSSNLKDLGDGVALFTSATAHGIEDGQKVSITGAGETEYNVTNQKIIKISDTTFAYKIVGSPASPASGSPIAAYSLVEEGQVKVLFTRDNDDTNIPSSSEVTTVKDNILTIKPAHVSDDDVIVRAPTAVPTNYTFTALSPDTTTMRTAIEDSLAAFYTEQVNVGEDVTENQFNSTIFNTVDVSTAQKLESFTLSGPSSDISIGREEIGTLGSIIFP